MLSSAKVVDEFFPDNHLQEVFVALSRSTSAICRAAEALAAKSNYKVRLHVDRRILYKTTVSAYYDIARYKQFHFSGDHAKRSDGVKRAAYFTKWITRFRPILCVSEDDISDPEIDNPWLMMLNEHLALEWGCLCVANDSGVRGFNLKEKFRNDLLYELHYREMNTDGLLAIFQMLSDTIRSKMKSPLFETSGES